MNEVHLKKIAAGLYRVFLGEKEIGRVSRSPTGGTWGGRVWSDPCGYCDPAADINPAHLGLESAGDYSTRGRAVAGVVEEWLRED